MQLLILSDLYNFKHVFDKSQDEESICGQQSWTRGFLQARHKLEKTDIDKSTVAAANDPGILFSVKEIKNILGYLIQIEKH